MEPSFAGSTSGQPPNLPRVVLGTAVHIHFILATSGENVSPDETEHERRDNRCGDGNSEGLRRVDSGRREKCTSGLNHVGIPVGIALPLEAVRILPGIGLVHDDGTGIRWS